MADPNQYRGYNPNGAVGEIPDEVRSQLVGIPGTCFISSATLQHLVDQIERPPHTLLPALSVLEVRVMSEEHAERLTPPESEYADDLDLIRAYRQLWEAHTDLLGRLERQANDVLVSACRDACAED